MTRTMKRNEKFLKDAEKIIKESENVIVVGVDNQGYVSACYPQSNDMGTIMILEEAKRALGLGLTGK
ncbi:hypothetical protein EHQ08_09910 [Listeria monocytogenes]|uniref:hypothetical protein n=1 Tax=Listeria monocytogenes TaxID=1639 RepID=UPI00086F3229|nr:hypothetical protein [Listeria monocytogenes]EKE4545875.1 hypothetical protein [Listeria monocytogenes serotype 1/2a]EAC4904255.1 hypothetical protein [Listeria monocytogenes]EAC7780658.1 hypothetical protein [Listeria monocytogenes]EAC8691124.1 hypothetical protein [Listeria monocytogenes]EAD3656435.1 hypothetical protein [Listeria monocytogenes]